MSLPYETTTTGRRALDEIQRVLDTFGCSKFGTMTDAEKGELLVQFEYRGRQVQVAASTRGYAAAWLRQNPWSRRRARTKVEHERRALEIARVATYSVLRDWIKGQVTAIETGILSFEGAFLGQIMLPSGHTFAQYAQEAKLLPAPAEGGQG